MGKYPVEITDEENAKMAYPFLPIEEYPSIYHLPGGTIVTVRGKPENIPKWRIAQMVRINKDIYLRRVLEDEKKTADAAGPENT